jgi:hypothetical protein
VMLFDIHSAQSQCMMYTTAAAQYNIMLVFVGIVFCEICGETKTRPELRPYCIILKDFVVVVFVKVCIKFSRVVCVGCPPQEVSVVLS